MPFPRSLPIGLLIVSLLLLISVSIPLVLFDAVADMSIIVRACVLVVALIPAITGVHLLSITLYKYRSKPSKSELSDSILLDKLFSESTDAVLILDADTLAVVRCNETVSKLLGSPSETIIGKTVANVFPEVQAEKASALFSHLNEATPEKNGELALTTSDGLIRHIEFSSKYLANDASAWIMVVGRDVTSRVQTIKAITDKSKLAERLASIDYAINSLDDYDNIALSLITSLSEITNISRLTIGLLSQSYLSEESVTYPTREISLPSARKIDVAAFPYWDSFNKGTAFKCYEAPYEPTLIEYFELEEQPNFLPASIITLPIWFSGKALGLLIFESSTTEIFNDSLIDFFLKLSHHVGLAIKNAEQRMLEDTRLAQLQIISKLPQRILESTSIEMMLQETGRHLLDYFHYDNVFLFLFDEVLEELYLFSSVGREADYIDVGLRLCLGEGLPGEAAKTGKYVLANDIREDKCFVNFFPGLIDVKSELAIPIRKGPATIGVLDVINSKPHRFSEADVTLLETIASQLATALMNAYSYECLKEHTETLEAYKEHLAGDLALASRLQNNLLPWDFVHPNIDVSIKYLPQEEIGGDYAKIAYHNEWIYIIIGDVSGHGIAAALVMSGINNEVERLISRGTPPCDLALKVNDYIATNFGFMGLYLTFFCGRLNFKTGTLEYINAGHQPILVQSTDGKIIALESSNFPLGLLKDEFAKHIAEDIIFLKTGSRIFLYTDGLINERVGYDEQKLIELIQEHANKPIAEIADHIIAISTLDATDGKAEDDRLIVAVEFRENIRFSETFSSFENIDTITKKLVRLCNMLGYPEDDTMMLHLAIYEMMVNSIKHGHRYDTTKTATINGTILEDSWVISVSDQGPGFDYDRIYSTSLDFVDIYQTSGRGILLTKQIVDSMMFENGGCKVTLSSRVNQSISETADHKRS
jgi:PAS domain S-box-containing protein